MTNKIIVLGVSGIIVKLIILITIYTILRNRYTVMFTSIYKSPN